MFLKWTKTSGAVALIAMAAACNHIATDNVADVAEFDATRRGPAAIVPESPEPVVPALLDSMPPGGIRLRLNVTGNYAEVFNDSNHVHLAAAEAVGIEPLSTTRSHWQLRRPLVRLATCQDYYLEKLTYSVPYMVPEGAAMVREIGRRFRDSLAARGGGDYRIRVTSVLRTPDAVRRLRRVNKNAVDSSVHQYGTTVDISYANFAASSADVPRTCEDLKGLLAEILLAMRDEGKCFVKYERNQPCFHITCRPVSTHTSDR